MTKEFGVGVIGMGRMGQAHSRAYLQTSLKFPDSDIKPCLIICSDNVPERAKQAQDVLGFADAVVYWTLINSWAI